MKKKNKFIWPLFIFAIFLVIGYGVFLFFQQKTTQDLMDEIVWDSNISIAAINSERIQQVAELIPADITNNEDQLVLRNQVYLLGNLFMGRGVDSVYILVKKENKTFFISESTPAGDPLYVPSGTIYSQAPQEVNQAFADKKAYFAYDYSDEFGRYTSYFNPIYNKSGQEIGVLGVDVQQNYIIQALSRLKIILFFVWFLCYLISVLIYFYFRNIFILKKESLINEQKIRAVSDSISDGLVTVDQESKIIYWNKASEAIFSQTFKQAFNKKFSEVVKFKNVINVSSQKNIPDFSFVSANDYLGSIFEVELLNNKKKVQYYELLISITEVSEEKYYIGIFHDITRRKIEQSVLESKQLELEKLNELMVDRELKMVELKDKLSKIKKAGE